MRLTVGSSSNRRRRRSTVDSWRLQRRPRFDQCSKTRRQCVRVTEDLNTAFAFRLGNRKNQRPFGWRSSCLNPLNNVQEWQAPCVLFADASSVEFRPTQVVCLPAGRPAYQ